MSELSVHPYYPSDRVPLVSHCDPSAMPGAYEYLQSDFAVFDGVVGGADRLIQEQSNHLRKNNCVSIGSKDESHKFFHRQENSLTLNPAEYSRPISIEGKGGVFGPSAAEIPTRADDILKMALSGKMKVNEERLTPLHLACRFCPGNESLIAKILKAKPHLAKVPFRSRIRNVSHHTLNSFFLYRASKKRKYATAAFSRKTSPSDMLASDKDSFPIHIALSHNCTLDVAKLLIKQAPNILLVGDGDGLCPLSVALRCRVPEEIIQLLISINKDSVRCLDTRMNLPLHHACIRGCSLTTAEQLSQAYPNAIHEKNFNGKTPLELLQSNNACSDEVYSYLQSIAFQEENVEEVNF